MGHEVQALGVHDDLGEIRRAGRRVEAAHRLQPARGFDDITIFDQNVVSRTSSC